MRAKGRGVQRVGEDQKRIREERGYGKCHLRMCIKSRKALFMKGECGEVKARARQLTGQRVAALETESKQGKRFYHPKKIFPFQVKKGEVWGKEYPIEVGIREGPQYYK